MSFPEVFYTVFLAAAWAYVFAVVGRDLWRDNAVPGTRRLTAALFLFSLVLDIALCTRGPGDLHVNLSSVYLPTVDYDRGQAPIALFRALRLLLGGLHDTGVSACNFILSSFAPVLLFATVSRLGVDRRASAAAAFVAAATPLLIVFSGTLNSVPSYLFSALASVYACVRLMETGERSYAATWVAATVLAALSRPEGAHVLIFPALIAVTAPADRARRVRLLLATAALGLLTLAYLKLIPGESRIWSTRSWEAILHDLSELQPYRDMVIAKANTTPVAWSAAALFGLLSGAEKQAGRVGLLSTIGLGLSWEMTNMVFFFVGFSSQICSARYQVVLLLPFTLGLALFFERVFKVGDSVRPRWAVACLLTGFALATAATYGEAYETVLRPFSVDEEYRFVRQSLRSLPAGSTVYMLEDPVMDTGLIPTPDLTPLAGGLSRLQGIPSREACVAARTGAPDAYFFLGEVCGPDLNRWPFPEACPLLHSGLAGGVVEERRITARQMTGAVALAPDGLQIGLYHLRRALPCDALFPPVRADRFLPQADADAYRRIASG
jgi:hypothetical protein